MKLFTITLAGAVIPLGVTVWLWGKQVNELQAELDAGALREREMQRRNGELLDQQHARWIALKPLAGRYNLGTYPLKSDASPRP